MSGRHLLEDTKDGIRTLFEHDILKPDFTKIATTFCTTKRTVSKIYKKMRKACVIGVPEILEAPRRPCTIIQQQQQRTCALLLTQQLCGSATD